MITLRVAREHDAGALAAIAERTFRDTFAASNTAADMDAHCASAYGVDIQLRELRSAVGHFSAENGTELIALRSSACRVRLIPLRRASVRVVSDLCRSPMARAGRRPSLLNEVLSRARQQHAD
jgi:hypothetical protein